MRVSMQCGRAGNGKHNDRSYRNSSEHENDVIVKSWNGDANIQNAEIEYYRRAFSKALNAQNEKHRKRRQYGRIKKIKDVYECERYKPEEMILQIGDMQQHPTAYDFQVCLQEYIKRMQEWNKQHGRPFMFLDIAVHLDEHTPHAHIRRVWQYFDANNVLQIGQEKALERAGVPLPVPSKKNRRNNRKMTFDALQRIVWQQVCNAYLHKKYGIRLETEPRKYERPHLTVKEYKDYVAAKAEKSKQKQR